MPRPGEKYSYWRPQDNDRNPYIQVDLEEESLITGISTQGHFNPATKEFATSYKYAYKIGNNWRYEKVCTL